MLLMLLACRPEPPEPAPGADDVARLIIEPAGVLLVPGSSETLTARAYDADGDPVDVAVTWSSADPSVAVDDGGRVSATGALGSSQLVARAGDVEAVALAVVAQPAAGALLVSDAQIVGQPTPVDAGAPFDVGFRYEVELDGVVTPAVDALVLSTGSKSVAGRVVSSDGARVVLEQISIDEAFDALDIDQTLHLDDLATTVPLERFRLGVFECEIEGSVGSLALPVLDVALLQTETLDYQVVWNDEVRSLSLVGSPLVRFELEPTFEAAVEGSVSCRATLKEYQIPFPGALAPFLATSIPVGVGLDLGGKFPVADFGLNLQGEASADLALGFACNGDDCGSSSDVQTNGQLHARPVLPNVPTLRFEPSASVYVWSQIEAGVRFESALRLEGMEAKAGLSLEASVASEETQAKDPAYASSYAVSLGAEIGPTGFTGAFFRLLGVAFDFLHFESTDEIGHSPTGSFRWDKRTFDVGDEVTFSIALDQVSFPLYGYNVENVRVYRAEPRSDGSLSLILAGEALPTPEQTAFEILWVATVPSSDSTEFVAFVQTGLVPALSFEVPKQLEGSPFGTGDLVLAIGQGQVWTWGYEPVTDSVIFVPTGPVPGLSGVVQVDYDENPGTSVALLSDGSVRMWGIDPVSGTYDVLLDPVPVPGLEDPLISLSAGTGSTLGVGADGVVWAWGPSCYYSLGTRSPSVVPGLVDVVQAVGDPAFVYALTRTGQLVLRDFDGQIVPVLDGVAELPPSSTDRYLARKTDGTVWNLFYQNATQVSAATADPELTVPLDDVISVGAGFPNLALRRDGTVWSWTEGSPAQPVPGLSGIVAIGAGNGYSLALVSDGAVWGWGYTAFLGLGIDNTMLIVETPVEILGFNLLDP